MKRFIKSILLMCITMMCILSVPSSALAANNAPGQVKGLKATAGESTVTLKWKKVSKAKGYNIYLLNTATNTYSKAGTTKGTSFTIKKLTNGTTYTYCVAAYRVVKSKTYEGTKSALVKATPQVKKPGTVNLSVNSCSDQKISLKWKKISGASGYEVSQYNPASKKFESIGTVTGTTVTVKDLTNGQDYQFRVRAYRTIGGVTRYGDSSSAVKVRPIVVSSDVKSFPTMGFKATVRKTVNAPLKTGSGSVTVAKGTKVTVSYRTSGNCTCVLSNNKTVYIKNSNLNFTSCIYDSKKDISNSLKEDFVNSRGYHSKTGYLVWISLYKQRMYIFKGSQCNWRIEKSFKCSTGKAATATPKGTYSLWKKYYFFPFDKYSYANYASYFSSNAIHSWVKLYGSGAWYRDGSLGNPASHGCVRLGDSDVKYVYNKVPMGTTIVIY